MPPFNAKKHKNGRKAKKNGTSMLQKRPRIPKNRGHNHRQGVAYAPVRQGCP